MGSIQKRKVKVNQSLSKDHTACYIPSLFCCKDPFKCYIFISFCFPIGFATIFTPKKNFPLPNTGEILYLSFT